MKIRKYYKSFKNAWLYEISSITSRLSKFGSTFKSRLIWTRYICWDLCQFELYHLHEFYCSFLKALFMGIFRGTANGLAWISKTWNQPPAASLGSLIRSGRAWQTLDTDLWRGGPGWILILTFLSREVGILRDGNAAAKTPCCVWFPAGYVTSTGSLGIQGLWILIRDKENLGMVLCASSADDSTIRIPFLHGCSAGWDHPTEVLHYSCLHRDKIPGSQEGSEAGWGVGIRLREPHERGVKGCEELLHQ